MRSTVTLDQVRGAVTEGNLQSIRHRQTLLQSLHEALRENADAIIDGIQKDFRGGSSSSQRQAEAEAEFYLTMRAVRDLYGSLDFEASMKQEYLLAHGLDNASRSIGFGLVVVRPATHTRFNCIVSPIAAAIAAGNCVCLEISNTLLAIDGILKRILPECLNANNINAFCITSSPPAADSTSFNVDQTGETSPEGLGLLSNPKSRTIAIIDRTADLEHAAKEVVKARFSFEGTSPYSPDIVIVNDFVRKEFVSACIKQASTFFAGAGTSSKAAGSQQRESVIQKALQDAEAKQEISSFGSSSFSIVEVHDKSSPVTSLKISGYRVLIVGSTSLIDSIMSQQKHLLAAYIFASAPAAKFVAQHIDAGSTYVNAIPAHLLVGPAAPTTTNSDVPDPGCRYNAAMFTQPRPQYILSPPADLSVLETIFEDKEASRKLREDAVAKLKPTGQAPGHALGFFEQGILIGVGLFLTVAVPALGYGSWLAGRSSWKFARQKLF